MNNNIDAAYKRTEAGETHGVCSHGVWPSNIQIYEKEEAV